MVWLRLHQPTLLQRQRATVYVGLSPPDSNPILVLRNLKRGEVMPEKNTVERARRDARKGKAPSTQAGEFVREEVHHVRAGKHGARSPQQAIAIGLSKARRAGIKLALPKGPVSVRKKAKRDAEAGEHKRHRPSRKRSRAVFGALQRESRRSATRQAMSRQAKNSAAERGKRARRTAAQRAARTRKAA